MQIKTPTRCHLAPIRKVNTKTQKTANVDEDVEKLEPPGSVDGNVKWCRPSGKSVKRALRTPQTELATCPHSPASRHTRGELASRVLQR